MNSMQPVANPFAHVVPTRPSLGGRAIEAPKRKHAVSKRRCKAFHVPGAEVEGMRLGWFRSRPLETYLVRHISRGGLCVQARGLKRGDRVSLVLSDAAGEERISLTGRVRRTSRVSQDWSEAWIDFDAYGSEPGRNSPDALDALRRLEARWG